MAFWISTGEPRPIALIVSMKAFLAVLLAVSFAMTALAGNPDSGNRTLIVRKIKPTAVTGTNIARPVKRIGNTYDTSLAIHVIDRTRIEQSGASSVAQLLRRYPAVGIR